MHPLDPLSADEIKNVADILRRDKLSSWKRYRFVTITLQEPAKAQFFVSDPKNPKIFSFRADAPNVERKAFAVLLDNDNNKCYEASVSLTHQRVLSFVHLPNMQPALTPEEYKICSEAVSKSEMVLEALKKRGVRSMDEVMIDLWSPGRGYNNEPTYGDLRIGKPLLFLKDDSDVIGGGYGRPIYGVTPIVDLNAGKVIAVEDIGVRPTPPKASEYDKLIYKNQKVQTHPHLPLKNLAIVQKDGPSFKLEGNHLQWQGWDMHVGFNAREGLSLHHIQIWDHETGKMRPVLYRASISEMVVPYGDPERPNYRKNAFDAGEEGLGFNANSLQLGCDCLGEIAYLDAAVSNSRGEGEIIKNAVCIHEEDVGIFWKHTNWRSNQAVSARCRRLSLSFFCTVANYDYGFFWYFYQDGSIEMEVKLTGILNTSPLPANVKESKYGVTLRPGLLAPIHQHFFNARLETCIDGPNNSLFEINVEKAQDPINYQKNAFTAKYDLLRTESEAQRNLDAVKARHWRVANVHTSNISGHPVGYRLIPGENTWPLLDDDAPVMKRAFFLSNQLWVTPFHEKERYPTGEYPNQHPGGSGLPEYTKNNRSIVDTDLVLWYTVGTLHIPRLEEWPVMPVAKVGFAFKPDGFFNSNPTAPIFSPMSKL